MNSSGISVLLSDVFNGSGRDRMHFVVLPDAEKASQFCNDLYNFFDEQTVFYFPCSSDRRSSQSVREATMKVQRTSTIAAISQQRNIIAVTYPESIEQEVVHKRKLSNSILHIARGDRLPHDFIRDIFFENGFSKVDFVSQPGEFAVRGSIIDVFSYSNSNPYRIDFFSDEVENIKEFNNDTQISIREVESVDIYPDLYTGIEKEDSTSIFNTLPKNSVIWLAGDELYSQMQWYTLADGFRKISVTLLSGKEDGLAEVTSRDTFIKELSSFCKEGGPDAAYRYDTLPQPSFNRNFDILLSDIRDRINAGYRVRIITDNPLQGERLKKLMTRLGQNLEDNCEYMVDPDGWLRVVRLSLQGGYIDNVEKICWYTDHQIFEKYHRVSVRRTVEKSERMTVNELNAFRIGDYIVHLDYGVGQFGGLVKTNINGKVQEAVKLVYKDNDIVFISIHGIHRLSRFKSKDGAPPKIYRLGSKNWEHLKTTAKSKVKDIARNLIKLYSERSRAQGFAFSKDSDLQYELESSFMFEDTPDQQKAVEAVKADMEKACPMDRLICGDVGFGKTEVAVRAAFKAAVDGKQVAVLVPTTILALQHYRTFSERLSGMPCTVDYLSRLRTAREIREVLANLQSGRTDIIIGTHKLLGKSVKFKDLGLLIVDEEQKFGVSAKERLRELKSSVDTITMTATPIPRTLQFSLMGARDLSIINTPPPNRLPVHTEIIDSDYDRLREIINYELSRGGQLFLLHNKVEELISIESIVRNLCPGIRTCIAHGQMESRELEQRILDFMEGEYDMLICTTIVENGLDIPNANTIIINQAQNFGLSDLHQLRGRVGRSNRKAFCYLVAPPLTVLTDDARRRLQAIESFSDLGSGFNIAMQDLDIRGAGNLLGGEQSGFISEMGFETYQKILSEALVELHQEAFTEDEQDAPATPLPVNFTSDCHIETDLEVLIPDSYINIVAEKIRLYKLLDSMTTERELLSFAAEMEDRFGSIPQQVKELMNVVRLRVTAQKLGFEKIMLKKGQMICFFISNKMSPYYRSETFTRVLSAIQNGGRRFALKEQNDRLSVTVADVESVQMALNLLSSI